MSVLPSNRMTFTSFREQYTRRFWVFAKCGIDALSERAWQHAVGSSGLNGVAPVTVWGTSSLLQNQKQSFQVITCKPSLLLFAMAGTGKMFGCSPCLVNTPRGSEANQLSCHASRLICSGDALYCGLRGFFRGAFDDFGDAKFVCCASRKTVPRVRETLFFWIKSSALRAFGGCLGSKRR